MNILITGASGYLGSKLIDELLKTEHAIFAISSNKQKLQALYLNSVNVFDYTDFYSNDVPFNTINLVVHCGFARTMEGNDIADSLVFTEKLFEFSSNNQCDIINISSRSVYGQNPNIPWNEYTSVMPNNLYALGKFSTELLLKKYSSKNKATNLRLAGLVSPIFDDRIVNKFINKVIANEQISIIGGKQQFPLMDIKDAVSAIITIINSDLNNWKFIYNLGIDKMFTITDIADLVKDVAKDFGFNNVINNFTESDATLFADMDSSHFYKDFEWKPKITMKEIIRGIFEFKLKNK